MLERCHDLRLKGTFLLAPEGINGAVGGSREGVDGILDYLRVRNPVLLTWCTRNPAPLNVLFTG